MVTLTSGKMAKSVGNVLDVERAVNLHGRNAVRMWLLQSHYSQPIEYSEEILEEKRRSYERLMRLYLQISRSQSSSELSDALAARLSESLDAAMQDDLNTPSALATLFEVAGRAGREISTRPEAAAEFASLAEAIEEVMTIFGFDLKEAPVEVADGVHYRRGVPDYLESKDAVSIETLKIPKEIMDKVRLRDKARHEKDWATADRLRDELHSDGWAVEDTSEGPILSRR
jgi:cysteinyl-tRNA synthetase